MFIAKKDYIFSREGFNKYFANTLWLLVEKVIRLFSGLFIGAYVARYLGPSQYGMLQYAVSFVFLFSFISNLGLENILMRNAIINPHLEDELFGTAIVLRVIGSVLLIIIVTCAMVIVEKERYIQGLIVLIAFGYIFQSSQILEYYFKVHVLGKYVSCAYIMSILIVSFIKLYLVHLRFSLYFFALIIIFEWFIQGVFLYILFRRKIRINIRWRFKFEQMKSLMHDSMPLVFSGFVIMIYMKIDQVMLRLFLGMNAVGQYAAAVRISDAWYFIPIVISNSLFPAIVNSKKNNEKLYYMRLQKLYDLMVWVSILITLVVFFESKYIIRLLYGKAFSSSNSVLIVIIWTGIIVSFGIVSNKWLVAENYQKYRIMIDSVGALINIYLNYLLIPRIGVVGAGYATLFSYYISFLLTHLIIKKLRIQIYMFFMALIAPLRYIFNQFVSY